MNNYQQISPIILLKSLTVVAVVTVMWCYLVVHSSHHVPGSTAESETVKQSGMSDFAEELTGLKSATENQEDSGSKLSPKALLTLECPPHSADSVAFTSSCSVVRTPSPSLFLEYSMPECRLYQGFSPCLQATASQELGPQQISECQH
ncbi:unnamed protein product [Candidula unifasciata]|uniref:Uncharacterized protein n=1 Tax=Candidula unifasciata TaxID=100452 RepID=A0A8S3ZZG5_9EUPU|nr:unnamed protein product [Candidula unifasciata]